MTATPDDVAGLIKRLQDEATYLETNGMTGLHFETEAEIYRTCAAALEASRREFDGAMALYHVARKRAEAAEAAITAARLAGLEEAAEEAEQWEQPGGRIAARIRARIAALKATAA